MASVTVILKRNKPKANGEYPLYLRIIKNRKAAFEAIGISVSEELWDEKNKRVKSKYPNSARVNNFIAKKIAQANDKVLELEGKTGGVKQIKKELNQKSKGSFIEYFNDYLETVKLNGYVNTHRKAKSILKKLSDYIGGTELTFDEFTLDFLKSYEKYLRIKGNSTNTIHTNLKVMRMLFNKAVEEDVIQPYLNPFLKFKLKWDNVEKVFLTESELKAFEEVKTSDSTIRIHQDMFVFACYAGGIRISDLLKLKWDNYDGEKVSIFIQKTKENLSVYLPNKAIEILEKYKPKDKAEGFIFPILKNDEELSDQAVLLQKISSATAHANKNLKSLAKSAKIEKTITFHTSRHTWATRALDKGIDITEVSKLMGHSNLQVTMGYTKIVSNKLKESVKKFN